MTKQSLPPQDPAFPCEWDYINSSRSAANGMSLRDYFAAKAMQGQIATDWDVSPAEFAEWSYKMADAMLKARA